MTNTLTDEEVLEGLMFDIRIQYALRTTSFKEQPLSENSLTNFRRLNYKYLEKTGIDLIKEEVNELSKNMKEELKIDGKMLRMDSMMVSSSCKKMSRLDLVYGCIEKLIKRINKIDEKFLTEEDKKFLKKSNRTETIYRCPHGGSSERLQKLSEYAKALCERVTEDEVTATEEYKLFKRWIDENIGDDGILKSGKELLSTSLQNPSDADATYRQKYGDNVGYIGNIVETFNDKNAIITSYDIEENIYSDVQFIEDEIKGMKEQEPGTKLMVDSSYYSDKISQKGKEKNIDIITTGLVGYEPDNKNILEFEIDEKYGVIKCPNGIVPNSTHITNGIISAQFDKAKCDECPYKDNCKVKMNKKSSSLKIALVQIHTAKLRTKLKDTDYKKLSNKRAGIEGIPSVLRRVYNVDNIPVRGKVRLKLWFGMKILAINVKRFAKCKVDKNMLNKIFGKVEMILYFTKNCYNYAT